MKLRLSAAIFFIAAATNLPLYAVKSSNKQQKTNGYKKRKLQHLKKKLAKKQWQSLVLRYKLGLIHFDNPD